MSEELRPCPQCGAVTKRRSKLLDYWDCTECEMELFDDYLSWWCWKEIDRLKSKNESRDAEVESFIPSGWEFDTADFSIRGADGYVCLRRDKKGTEWWHGLSEEDRERTDLYVYGRASSLVQAIKNAVSNVREESK